ncbi:UDP-4-amino-4,6-dideoxy-N-acetyl-beta-L-altrosamine N-acetyltransferase [Saccharospirillum sp. MSK14-1]|uniref:UDP-4-amino-4, 6-dideoxy-N-acetyl-beta-L-altrosamine N-acetyltransferase n=1 Tax=Saccharospirillum sp. MSK14-1 TaxID=1897632 RepID=UPI000D3925F5|nr:UDP-4-amino-4,6-dideoxy-N-acetyl-beta-L-altrosamine N-acetyltransferase [Saccharospirillum sp. MSK14-1]PTY36776.1 UDP-4-amino-4,6-dideoxy-N-acetyl-beta-L-altrosamine N-acetyltransferase [Saccharospirillum sp. MSK14-1]
MTAASLRPLASADLDRVRHWRNHPRIRAAMYHQHEIQPDEHQRWFESANADAGRHLYVFLLEDEPSGFVHFRALADGVAEWGFYLAPDVAKGSGRLLGECALQEAFQQLGYHTLQAEVRADNEASLRFHRRLGFVWEKRIEIESLDVDCFRLKADQWRERVSHEC